ncbi:sulfatase-like hydrolase/transferase [Nocardioides sp. BGMRC 2183]|nr:sulfatase-like hydrolase/transferase [Nocardioides sp. BGMRC 2183]
MRRGVTQLIVPSWPSSAPRPEGRPMPMTDQPQQGTLTDRRRPLSAISRRTVVQGMGVAGIGLTAGSGIAFPARSGAASTPPNVIFISIDDLAWKELGCYGNTFNETPHIDRLAQEGVRFTDAYSAASICSPTRASLMTGRYPANVGITDYLREQPAPSRNYLSTEFATIPSVLREHGYVSGLVGKWHLTEVYSGDYEQKPGSPYAHGFDDVRVSETRYIGGGDYSYPYSFMPEVPGTEGEYLTDRLAAEAVDFIATNKDRPFFLHLSNFAVHTTLSAKPDLVAKYRAKPGAGENGNNAALAAMLESIDDQVGAVLAKLEELEIADNTLVMLMSDNGGDPAVTTNAPLRGNKSDLYEGGIRVAMVAKWPDAIAPGGVSSVPVSTMDVFPTILDVADVTPPASTELDGSSLAPVLADGAELDRDALYWVYPHFHFLGATPQAAVRSGRYKLLQHLRDRRVELYDLEDDLGETTDLSAQLPTVAADLRDRLETHIAETGIVAAAPTSAVYQAVDFDDDFDDDAVSYDAFTRPAGGAAAQLEVAGGALALSGTSDTLNLYRTGVTPGDGAVAMTVQVRAFAEANGTQDTLFVGLVKDANNFAVIWHNNARKRTGWDAVVNGVEVPRAGAEPLGALENQVDLSTPGSRLSFVVDGRTFTAYADPGGADAWQFLFKVDIAEVLDLSDPAVRAEYRYGFGARINAGTMQLERVEARRRTAALPTPVLTLRDDRIDAHDKSVAVRVTVDGAPVTGGTVELERDGVSIGSAEVSGGVAHVPLAESLAPGVYRLDASYSGTTTVAAAQASLTLRVTRVPRRPSTVVARPRRRVVRVGKRIRLRVRVRAGRSTATGRVEVISRGKTVAQGRLRRDGTVALAWIARRPLGRQTFRVRYLGSADVAPDATTVTVRVARPRRRGR